MLPQPNLWVSDLFLFVFSLIVRGRNLNNEGEVANPEEIPERGRTLMLPGVGGDVKIGSQNET